MRRKKNKRYKKVILNLIIYSILIFILVYSGIKIYNWYKDKTNNHEISEKIKDTVIVQDENEDKEEYTVDFNKLKEQNNESVAWIKVNNTNIEYPIVKAANNNFYLNHSFDKSKNSAGWIFADYRNKFDGTDKNIIIYGHNMRDNSMFGSMKNILNSEWYDNEENTNIILNTENEKCIYKVFSVYKIESEDYYIRTEFSNDSEFEQFIKTLKSRSIKEFNTDISKEDSILTLSTCANNNKYRVVLHAKKYSNKNNDNVIIENIPNSADKVSSVEIKEETEGGEIYHKTQERKVIEEVVNALKKIEVKDKTNIKFSDNTKTYILKLYDGTTLTYCFQNNYYNINNVNYKTYNYEELMKIKIE